LPILNVQTLLDLRVKTAAINTVPFHSVPISTFDLLEFVLTIIPTVYDFSVFGKSENGRK